MPEQPDETCKYYCISIARTTQRSLQIVVHFLRFEASLRLLLGSTSTADATCFLEIVWKRERELVGVLSPVSHQGLYQRERERESKGGKKKRKKEKNNNKKQQQRIFTPGNKSG